MCNSACRYQTLKTGKAPGEDDIRPELLKAQINVLYMCGVRWLTRVCQVACRTMTSTHSPSSAHNGLYYSVNSI